MRSLFTERWLTKEGVTVFPTGIHNQSSVEAWVVVRRYVAPDSPGGYTILILRPQPAGTPETRALCSLLNKILLYDRRSAGWKEQKVNTPLLGPSPSAVPLCIAVNHFI